MRVVHIVNCMGPSGGMEKGVGTMIRRASPDIEHVVVVAHGGP